MAEHETDVRAVTDPRQSGLTLWRQRQAEDKKRRVAELERLRVHATVEVRDGREFLLVRLPDLYGWGRRAA